MAHLGMELAEVMANGHGYVAGFGAPSVEVVEIPHGERGTVATLERMGQLAVGPEGAHNQEIRFLAQRIVAGVGNKDYEGEARAIFNFMREHVRYTLDPRGMEWVQTPYVTALVQGQGDCFTHGTRVLRREGHALVTVESLRAGDEVWGLGRWSRVERAWSTGSLETWLVALNNGSTVRLSPGHKVYVADCESHANRKSPCSCPVSNRAIRRIELREVQEGMVVLQPESVSYGTGEFDPDRAYVEGLYLSDGWSEKSRFGISGKDGHPKESQKREVQAICESLGIHTRWDERYISVNDREWAERLSLMGKRAPAKRALTLDLQQQVADRLLDGILADAGKNTNGNGSTFTTTSRELWLQARVLLKQRGVSCSSRYLTDHGGLGTNPIWRLGIRDTQAKKAVKLLRIKSIVRDGQEAECHDVTTDDHYVWLPEADWTVSNCDDHATTAAALAVSLGHGAAFRTVRGDRTRPDEWSHVYAVIGVVKGGKEYWYPVDSTEKNASFGKDPPGAEKFPQKTWVVVPA